MKKLEASYLSSVDKESSLQLVSSVLDKLEKNSIDMVPWPVFSYKPEALFAIAYNDDYNFEFNCIGTCLLGFGTGKSGRTLLPEQLIRKIKHLALIKSSNDSGIFMADWELTLMIPLEVFSYHQINSLKGRQSKVNFFKCGDDLPEPHFLAWRNIIAASPDFHLPEFFGTMHFV